MTPHKLYCGRSGSGKSEAVLREVIAEAMLGKSAIILQDPHGPLAKDFLLHLAKRHQLHRVIYDRLADTDLCPTYEFLVPATPETHPDALQRYQVNDDRIRKFIALLIRRGGLKDTAGNPNIEKSLLDAARLFVYQNQWTYLPWLAQLYTPGSAVFDHMVANCTDEDTRLQFLRFARLNPQAKGYETGAGDKRLRACLMSPALLVRCGRPSFDFNQALRNRVIIILDGEGCNPDATAIMMSSLTLKVYDFCRTEKKYPVHIVADEAINAGLLGLQESDMLAQVRKWKMPFTFLVQDLNFATPEIKSNILQNTLHLWFAQESPESAALAAADIAKRIVDPLKLHHREFRTRTADDGFERISNHAKSTTKDKHGKTISKTENSNTSIVRKTKEVQDAQDRYMSLNDQEILVQQKIMKLGPGWRWTAGDLEPHWEPMEPHLWEHLQALCGGTISEEAVMKLKEAKLQKAIAEVKSSPAYVKPVLIPTPSPSTPSPPKPLSAAQRSKAERGIK